MNEFFCWSQAAFEELSSNFAGIMEDHCSSLQAIQCPPGERSEPPWPRLLDGIENRLKGVEIVAIDSSAAWWH